MHHILIYAKDATKAYVHRWFIYDDAIMNVVGSQITSLTIIIFTQSFIQAQIKDHNKVPRHWTLCVEFTDHRWIPLTKGQ